MKSFRYFALSALLMGWVSGSRAATNTNALVFIAEAGEGLRASYWADWRTVLQQKPWFPGAEPFPADLDHLIGVGRAAVLSVCGGTNTFLLNAINVHRISVPPRIAALFEGTSMVLSNHWAVALHYSVCPKEEHPRPFEQRVVVLFDGTVANERFAKMKEIVAVQREGADLPQPRATPKPDPVALDRPLSSGRRIGPEQAPSSVWRAGEVFPIDFNAAIAMATSCIKEKVSVEGALILNELDLQGLRVTDDPKFQSLWMVRITLREEGRSGRMFDADILLDGKIVHCAETRTISR
jgi:hypothetical protein